MLRQGVGSEADSQRQALDPTGVISYTANHEDLSLAKGAKALCFGHTMLADRLVSMWPQV